MVMFLFSRSRSYLLMLKLPFVGRHVALFNFFLAFLLPFLMIENYYRNVCLPRHRSYTQHPLTRVVQLSAEAYEQLSQIDSIFHIKLRVICCENIVVVCVCESWRGGGSGGNLRTNRRVSRRMRGNSSERIRI